MSVREYMAIDVHDVCHGMYCILQAHITLVYAPSNKV